MTSSVLFLFLAYFLVFFSLLFFVVYTLHERKKYLQKLYEEGFLD